MLLFLLIANVTVAPFFLYVTIVITNEEAYRSNNYLTHEELFKGIDEAISYFEKEYPDSLFECTWYDDKTVLDNGTIIYLHSFRIARSYEPKILSMVAVGLVLTLNVLCILIIAYPTSILCSRESAYRTQQIRKILFYGTGEMYFWESVMKHISQSKD